MQKKQPKNKEIKTRCTAELKKDFDRLSGLEGGSSKVLRKMIESYVKDKAEVAYEEQRTFTKKAKSISTRITEKESEQWARILEAEKKTTSQLLLSLVRARINKEPHYCGEEIKSLREASRQLQAVGRNFNQVLKAYHQGLIKIPMGERLGSDLKSSIENLSERIDGLISKSLKRDINE